MLHSSFDLETHARTRQADALRDADHQRLVAAAGASLAMALERRRGDDASDPATREA